MDNLFPLLGPNGLLALSTQSQILPLRSLDQISSPWKRQSYRPLRRSHIHSLQHLLQLRRRLPSPVPAVADNHGRLAVPLVEEVVDGVLDAGRVAPIVLRGDEHEGGMGGDFGGPALGVAMRVLVRRVDLGGDSGLVEEGEVPLGEVDEGEGDCCVGLLEGLVNEVADLKAGSRDALAADYHSNFRWDCGRG